IITSCGAKPGHRAMGGIEIARRVVQERANPQPGIFIAGVEKKRSHSDTCVEAGGRIGKKRRKANCRIALAGSEIHQSFLPFRSVQPGIASIGWRTNSLRARSDNT